MSDDLARIMRRLRAVEDADYGYAIIEHVSDVGVEHMRRQMGHDTWQLHHRTGIAQLSDNGSTAEAVIVADTHYAAAHNSGTRYQRPNHYFDDGFREMEREARALEGKIKTSIEVVLGSGGHPNPRSLF